MSKRMLEKLALPTVKEELPRLHASHVHMLPEEAETEYLKVCPPILINHLLRNAKCKCVQPCSTDCPAVARVWGDVPSGGAGEKARGGRVSFGSLCQRNHCLRDEEPHPHCHQTLPLEGDRLHLHRGKNI